MQLKYKFHHLYWKIADSKFVGRIKPEKLHRLWEENHLRRLLAHYNVDCVFDVGANYGQYARMLREKANYKGLILSFEPTPDLAKSLRERAAGDKKWIVIEQALSSRDGEQTFNIMVGDQMSSLSTPKHDEVGVFRERNKVKESIVISTKTLTSAYHHLQLEHGFQRPFLKLDTQGYDTEIVRHAKPTMRHFIALQSELAVKKLYEHAVDFREALALYEDCGFELSAFVPNNEGRFPRLIEVDCIMVRRDLLQNGS